MGKGGLNIIFYEYAISEKLSPQMRQLSIIGPTSNPKPFSPAIRFLSRESKDQNFAGSRSIKERM